VEIVDIKANKRDSKGKKAAKGLRAEGLIPAVIYGGDASEKLSLKTKDVFKALSGVNGRSVILQLGIDGRQSRHVVLQELQYHPITDKIFHADFLEIDLTKRMQTSVKLKFTGEPVGVKISGGVLTVHNGKINIEGLPKAVPSILEVDVSNLEISDKMTVNDIVVPDGIKKLDDLDMGVVSVAQPKKGPGGAAEEEGEESAEGADTADTAEAGDAKAEGAAKSEGAAEASDKKK
jgi:large subunit ribosomal protein L25